LTFDLLCFLDVSNSRELEDTEFVGAVKEEGVRDVGWEDELRVAVAEEEEDTSSRGASLVPMLEEEPGNAGRPYFVNAARGCEGGGGILPINEVSPLLVFFVGLTLLGRILVGEGDCELLFVVVEVAMEPFERMGRLDLDGDVDEMGGIFSISSSSSSLYVGDLRVADVLFPVREVNVALLLLYWTDVSPEVAFVTVAEALRPVFRPACDSTLWALVFETASGESISSISRICIVVLVSNSSKPGESCNDDDDSIFCFCILRKAAVDNDDEAGGLGVESRLNEVLLLLLVAKEPRRSCC
jgi:hypothetical protein